MAANTDPRLQNQVIYSIYVRNHTSEGTFRAVIPDLDHAGLPLCQPRLPRRQPCLRHDGGL